MNESPITAEDLTLYALHSIDSAATARIDVLLRSSSEARRELSQIRGDLAALALSTQQQAPPALSRQRLLKQVAREPRTFHAAAEPQPQTFVADAPDSADPIAPTTLGRLTQAERRSRMRLPRIVAEPEPMFTADEAAEQPSAAMTRDIPNAEAGRPEQSTFPEKVELPTQFGTPALSDKLGPSNTRAESTTSAEPLTPEAELRLRKSLAAGTLFQMPLAPTHLHDTELEDRYTPTASQATAEPTDQTRRSRSAVVLAWTGWVAAAGLAAATVFAIRGNVALHDQLRSQKALLDRNQVATARADAVLKTLESSASQRFVLARQDTVPIPSARVAYLPEQGSLVFQGTNLEQLPPDKTYELWLIPSSAGAQPLPAGTFKPDARGYATLLMPALPKGTVAGNFGVTIEDESGSTVPTLPILLIGQTS